MAAWLLSQNGPQACASISRLHALPPSYSLRTLSVDAQLQVSQQSVDPSNAP